MIDRGCLVLLGYAQVGCYKHGKACRILRTGNAWHGGLSTSKLSCFVCLFVCLFACLLACLFALCVCLFVAEGVA